MKFILFISLVLCAFQLKAENREYSVTSPDSKIMVKVGLEGGKPYYNISHVNHLVLLNSRLGLIREDADFSEILSFVNVSSVETITDKYELQTIKRRVNYYKANKRVFHLKNATGELIDIIFQVSNDGVVFRYYFPAQATTVKKIKEEVTSYHLSPDAKAFLQPMADAGSGWAQANPSYEEFYQQGIPVGTPSPIKAGWVYPALFQTNNNWVLISETFPQGDYCATRLRAASPNGEYSIGFPQGREVYPGGAVNPESQLPWYTPWRIIAIGSLKTIVESTLGTDVAKPAMKNVSFVQTGIASWSWPLLKDNQTIYTVQKQFIEYAADMKWQYCLIDAEWDKRIGYEKIAELAAYAKTKNIGLLLWYNSAGNWNTTPQTPRNVMLTHESRVKEFGRLKEMGIRGIKIDFFGGDGQSMIQYYLDILKDALSAELMVNFHGTTLPRGLERTYPNLVSMEAIKGMEFRTFVQAVEDSAANHCAMIPFTRNVFDPMDYTPMVLYKIPKIKRATTNGFELALPVLFQSGIQHLAETPEGMKQVPDYVKDFLRQLPASWEDVKFVDGFPGKLAVLARKSGNKWYVAGINGEKTPKNLLLDLTFLKEYKPGEMITDGAIPLSFSKFTIVPQSVTPITIKSNGGFVIVFTDK